MKDIKRDKYCIDDPDGIPSSIVGIFQIFSDKATTLLKGSALVAHPLHAVFRNCFATYRGWIMEHELYSIDFLPAQFDDTVKGAAESHLDKNCAYHWF